MHGDVSVACNAATVNGQVSLVCKIKDFAEFVHVGFASETRQRIEDSVNGGVEVEEFVCHIPFDVVHFVWETWCMYQVPST